MTRLSRLFGDTSFFGYSQVSMILCGMWPLKTKNVCLQALYEIYRVLIRIELIGSLLICGPVTLPYAFIHDQALFSETLSYEIQYITLLLKVWLFESTAARNLLRESLNIEKRMMRSGDLMNLNILKQNKKINVKLSIIYTFMIGSAFIMFCQALLYQTEVTWNEYKKTLNETIDPRYLKRSPIVFTLPYLSGKWFYVGMVSQTIGVIFVIMYSIATQSMFFAYVTFTVAQIQSLKNSLKNFEVYLDVFERKHEDESREEFTTRLLRQNVITHQKLIKYVRSLDGFLKYAILFDFFFYSLQIGATVTKILSEIKNEEFSAVVFHTNYLCFNYLGLHFNYRSAHEIIFESSGLSRSIYESKWYKQSVSVQKNYLMMMRQMKYPLSLHIGPLYAMSNELLILIIKAAYSYVTLLSKST